MKEKYPNSTIMNEFTIKNIPNLDICVLGALELFITQKIPEIPPIKNKKILVVGSGNAIETGKILFNDASTIFATESNYKRILKKEKFKKAILISSSGGKDSPLIAKELNKRKIQTILLTNNKNSKAAKEVSKVIIFPKQREPYTYNTSTYLAMILSKTKESPKKILKHLKKINKKIPKTFSKYPAFNLIIPSKFDLSIDMFQTKFDELFGPKVTARIFTKEEEKHAKTLVPSNKELFISIGEKNSLFGKKQNRLCVPLPRKADYASIIAITYFIIGKIQEQRPAYFKKNLLSYTKKASKLFKEEIKPIVE